MVQHLLNRLRLGEAATDDPNAVGKETGVDVTVGLTDGRLIGVQVTEVNPYPARRLGPRPGEGDCEDRSRQALWYVGAERSFGRSRAVARAITRKVEIAAKHSFEGYDEVWLLLCGGIPEHGAVVSTFVMTPWLSAEDLNTATDSLLRGSSYHGVSFFPSSGQNKRSILGIERHGGEGGGGAGRHWADSA